MSFALLLTGAVIVLATYLTTNQESQPTHTDRIVNVRSDMRKTECAEIHEENSKEFVGGRVGGQYFVDKKRVTRESYVRKILESIFKHKFPSVRPDWLINPKTGRKMEIDCYCKEMRLGVEIQGEQHYRYIPYFHRTYTGYLEMIERDKMKAAILRTKNVRLLRIPHSVPDNSLEEYIIIHANKILS